MNCSFDGDKVPLRYTLDSVLSGFA